MNRWYEPYTQAQYYLPVNITVTSKYITDTYARFSLEYMVNNEKITSINSLGASFLAPYAITEFITLYPNVGETYEGYYNPYDTDSCVAEIEYQTYELIIILILSILHGIGFIIMTIIFIVKMCEDVKCKPIKCIKGTKIHPTCVTNSCV